MNSPWNFEFWSVEVLNFWASPNRSAIDEGRKGEEIVLFGHRTQYRVKRICKGSFGFVTGGLMKIFGSGVLNVLENAFGVVLRQSRSWFALCNIRIVSMALWKQQAIQVLGMASLCWTFNLP